LSTAAPEIAVVVEDEWFIRMEMADALAEAGWKVVEFGSGEALEEHLGELSGVRLIVTDIRLGGPISGWDVAERCRAAHPSVAVIYCSGNSMDADRCVKDSVFLSKPCPMEILTGLARKLCAGYSAS
jgi:DNA-binding NtrC family response regulator